MFIESNTGSKHSEADLDCCYYFLLLEALGNNSITLGMGLGEAIPAID